MIRILLAILGLAVFFGSGVFASHVPDPQGFVNDFAGMLSSKFRIQLEQSLQNFEKETQAEIAVVTILSLQQDSIEDFAARLFEEWKIGKAQQDNGVLLLVAKEEQEVRIEVGYGLEPFITDGRAGSIIRQDITPLFKQGNYEEGIQKAVASLQRRILESEPESAQEKVRGKVS
ncbi:MAG: TPM domain-containing protein, partial [Candidatus Wildermuthbacteria bacterium]|nr:TPM domain-containing protein [Candidatus Wildermuthbacteria bacterium]